MRVCATCKQEKSIDQFYKYRNQKTKVYSCADCYTSTKLRLRYGISLETYWKMDEEQGGCCKICKRHKSILSGKIRKLHIDHCHITKRVRGLLCSKCNQAIGLLNDDPANARRLAEYLD